MASRTMERNAVVFNAAMSTAATARRWAVALELLAAMGDAAVRATAVSFAAALAAAAVGGWAQCLRLLQRARLEQAGATVETCGKVGRSWGNPWENHRKTFKKSIKRNGKHERSGRKGVQRLAIRWPCQPL